MPAMEHKCEQQELKAAAVEKETVGPTPFEKEF